MRPQRFTLIAALLLIVSACSSSSSETTTTAAATTTTAAATTTTADPAIAALQTITGDYTGEWNNTTYGSSGPIAMTLSSDDAGNAAIDMDIDGFVFGASNPDAEQYAFNVADVGGGALLDSAVFGPTTITIDATGAFTMESTEVPDSFIASMTMEGAVTLLGISGTYDIVFSDGGGAQGTFEMSRG